MDFLLLLALYLFQHPDSMLRFGFDAVRADGTRMMYGNDNSGGDVEYMNRTASIRKHLPHTQHTANIYVNDSLSDVSVIGMRQ